MGKKIFITGSNANLLSLDLGKHLTGRYVPYILFPLSFKEFIQFKGIQIQSQLFNTKEKITLLKLFKNYLEIGGIPKYVINPYNQYLSELVQNIVYRDIIHKYKIKHVEALNKLVQYTLSNFSRIISARKITQIIGVKNHSTVSQYLKYLQESYLIFIIYKYAHLLKEQYVAPKKVYAIDLALAKQYGFSFSDDLGHKLENIVFLSLKQKMLSNIFYFKYNTFECDFIIQNQGKIIKALQVTVNLNEKNKKREINGLLKAMQKFHLNSGLIITLEQKDEITIDNFNIKIIPIYEWLIQ